MFLRKEKSLNNKVDLGKAFVYLVRYTQKFSSDKNVIKTNRFSYALAIAAASFSFFRKKEKI